MKILFISNSKSLSAGDSVALLHILETFKNFNVDILVTVPSEGSFLSKLDELGLVHKIINMPMSIYPPLKSFVDYVKLPYRILKYIIKENIAKRKLGDCIKEFRPDVIHTNIGPIRIGYSLAKKHGIPHVWHIREYQKEDFGMRPFPSINAMKNRYHDDINHCIAITKDIFDYFQLNNNKDYVIYDGVIDKRQVKPINQHKQNYILFAGRLEDAKGIKVLLRAYDQYVINGGTLNLLVAGRGNEAYIKSCKELVSSTTLSKVHFLGQRSDVFDLMYDARIFIVPSKREGFGFITVEAMFNGVLVIGHNTGGTKEQFDNGLKEANSEIAYRYNKSSELVDLLKKLEIMPTDAYNRIAVQAQSVVCKLYDITTQAEKVYQIDQTIIKKHEGGIKC